MRIINLSFVPREIHGLKNYISPAHEQNHLPLSLSLSNIKQNLSLSLSLYQTLNKIITRGVHSLKLSCNNQINKIKKCRSKIKDCIHMEKNFGQNTLRFVVIDCVPFSLSVFFQKIHKSWNSMKLNLSQT